MVYSKLLLRKKFLLSVRELSVRGLIKSIHRFSESAKRTLRLESHPGGGGVNPTVALQRASDLGFS